MLFCKHCFYRITFLPTLDAVLTIPGDPVPGLQLCTRIGRPSVSDCISQTCTALVAIMHVNSAELLGTA